MNIKKINTCKKLIKESKKICIITGAGISTASGIPDFRSKDGIYSKIPKNIFDINTFNENPKQVYNILFKYIYNEECKPNTAHVLLKSLEDKDINREIYILTQNIDNLHKEANSSNVIELHGNIKNAICMNCKKKYKFKDIIDTNFNYRCNCSGIIKPDIVFFGEDIREMDTSIKILRECDLLLILGTSLQVYPVAGFSNYIDASTPIIIINKEKTCLDDDRMSIVFNDDINIVLKEILE